MEISVIIPVYNGERYLVECLDSVLSQKGVNYEVIIVDDGSTDSSGIIADRYASHDKELRVIHVANGGLSYARNHGIDIARGDTIVFVDADDMLFDNALGAMHKAMCETAADVIVAGFLSKSRSRCRMVAPSLNTHIISGTDAVRTMLYQHHFESSAWAKMYRRELFERNRFTPGLYYEDLDFNYRCLLDCKCVAVSDTPVYFYRQHAASILHVWAPRRLDVLTVVDNIEAHVTEHNKSLLPAARDRKFAAAYNVFLSASANKQHDVANRCYDIIKRYRRFILKDKHVRIKDRIGAFVSLFGRNAIKFVALLSGRS